MDTITIAGENVTISPRYSEGHVLTAGEASALNQTFFENVRNNLAKHVKDAKEANAFDLAAFQARVDEYAESYQFGVRTGGGRVSDPVEAEALDMAREIIRMALKNAGKAMKSKKHEDGITAEQITEAAKRYLDGPNGAAIREQASQRVDQRKSAAADALASLGV